MENSEISVIRKNPVESPLDRGLRRNRAGELEYLTFPLLEECKEMDHVFSTRLGGVSKGIFSSMNVSYTRGDSKEAVDENFRRIAEIMGRSIEDFVCADQTHTTNVRVVTRKDRGKGVTRAKDYHDVDGLITEEPGIILSTFYADCVPIFLIDQRHKAIGLSHSGWKGTVGRMAGVTVSEMRKAFGTEPEDLLAGIGPSICAGCYEVGEDVAEQFGGAFTDLGQQELILKERENGKYLLDLWRANKLILMEAGVLPEHIQVTDICTCCNPDYLFSHRASEGKRGNLGAFLCLKDELRKS